MLTSQTVGKGHAGSSHLSEKHQLQSCKGKLGGGNGIRASEEVGRSLYRQPHSSATMLGNLRTSSPSVERLMMSWSE